MVWEKHLRKENCAFLELVSLDEEIMWKRPLVLATDATLIKRFENGIQKNSMISVSQFHTPRSKDK